MDVFVAVVCGVLGLAVGSFLNVVIARVPEHVSIVRPPSRCPACEHPIAPRDNIPVVSWLVLRAKCRDCGEPISGRYPVVELMTATLFVLTAIRFHGSLRAFANLSFGFDSRGLLTYKDTHNLADIFDGFYLGRLLRNPLRRRR